jgi:hypothetical protein
MTRLLFLCVALAALLPATAGATLVPSRSIEELTQEAGAVIRGRVTAQRVAEDPESGRVFTLSTVTIDECYKGRDRQGAEVVVRQPGGNIGDLSVVVAGSAPLQRGQEVVLFLADREGPTRRLVGLSQGAWFVSRGPDGDARLSPERPLVEPRGSDATRRLPTLGDVERRVRGAAARE